MIRILQILKQQGSGSRGQDYWGGRRSLASQIIPQFNVSEMSVALITINQKRTLFREGGNVLLSKTQEEAKHDRDMDTHLLLPCGPRRRSCTATRTQLGSTKHWSEKEKTNFSRWEWNTWRPLFIHRLRIQEEVLGAKPCSPYLPVGIVFLQSESGLNQVVAYIRPLQTSIPEIELTNRSNTFNIAVELNFTRQMLICFR